MNGESANQKILCDIARCAFKVIGKSLSRDQVLARKVRSDSTGSRQFIREESITADIAATLLEQFPQHVEFTLFTAPEEKASGADWYWRIEKSGRAVHARVQAKRVQRTAFGQSDELGHVEIELPQLEQLIRETERASKQLPELQAWVATYARFDATPPCGSRNLQQCSRHFHHEPCANHGPSFWIANAEEILGLQKKELQVRAMIEHSVRLDCLLPCIDEGGVHDGPESKGFAFNGGLPPYQECVTRISGNAALRSTFQGTIKIAV